ncbi:Translationally-controlled tumor protein [Lemmus lemmus]
MISRTEGSVGDSLMDGNASAEEESQGTESTVVTHVDVMNHCLEETALPKRRQKSQQRLHEITQRSCRAD